MRVTRKHGERPDGLTGGSAWDGEGSWSGACCVAHALAEHDWPGIGHGQQLCLPYAETGDLSDYVGRLVGVQDRRTVRTGIMDAVVLVDMAGERKPRAMVRNGEHPWLVCPNSVYPGYAGD